MHYLLVKHDQIRSCFLQREGYSDDSFVAHLLSRCPTTVLVSLPSTCPGSRLTRANYSGCYRRQLTSASLFACVAILSHILRHGFKMPKLFLLKVFSAWRPTHRRREACEKPPALGSASWRKRARASKGTTAVLEPLLSVLASQNFLQKSGYLSHTWRSNPRLEEASKRLRSLSSDFAVNLNAARRDIFCGPFRAKKNNVAHGTSLTCGGGQAHSNKVVSCAARAVLHHEIL